ncbi:MAG: hotdog fold thioesterase [bacterium]|nr:hotdog fold thioesterase [bacterium]
MSSPKDVYDRMMDKDYYSQWMGVELISISEGNCTLKMTVRKEMLNGFGILHGGVSFAFADSAFAFASNSYGRLSVSMNGSMIYSKQAKEGDILIAKAKELVKGNKSGTYDVEVSNESSGEVVGLFRGTVYRRSSEI